MKQRYTSAATSINSKRMPAIYKKVDIDKGLILDYGCGRFFDSYGLPKNVHGYDKYNRPNTEELNMKYDKVLCSNVLNVIAEREIRLEVLEDLKRLGNTVYITVYEGNKTGIGAETKSDCYQLNRTLQSYLSEVAEVFGRVTVRNGMIIAE